MYYDYVNVTTHSHILYLLFIVFVWVFSLIVLLTLYNLCMSLEEKQTRFYVFIYTCRIQNHMCVCECPK